MRPGTGRPPGTAVGAAAARWVGPSAPTPPPAVEGTRVLTPTPGPVRPGTKGLPDSGLPAKDSLFPVPEASWPALPGAAEAGTGVVGIGARAAGRAAFPSPTGARVPAKSARGGSLVAGLAAPGAAGPAASLGLAGTFGATPALVASTARGGAPTRGTTGLTPAGVGATTPGRAGPAAGGAGPTGLVAVGAVIFVGGTGWGLGGGAAAASSSAASSWKCLRTFSARAMSIELE